MMKFMNDIFHQIVISETSRRDGSGLGTFLSRREDGKANTALERSGSSLSFNENHVQFRLAKEKSSSKVENCAWAAPLSLMVHFY